MENISQNHKISQIGQFTDGKQIGEWNFYHFNEGRAGIGILVDGKRNGIWKWYFNNGQIKTVRKWKDGLLIDVVICYDGQGNELNKGTLINGNGTMKLYDSDGLLLEILQYENGENVK
jgi:antitoxin component YwqK of YwqJK toxin-antitoxin module